MVACAAVPARRAALLALAFGFLVCALPTSAADTGRLVDRVVAVVDDDPILESEIEQAIGLGLVERAAGEDDRALRRRVLDGLIEQRLRFHEVDSFGFTSVPVTQIEAHYREIAARFADQAALHARLAELSLTESALRQLVARQLMVLTYVEERLGARVLVGLDDIRAYYQTTLTSEMAARHEPLPPIEAVRENIRALLKEQRLNEEIARWTDDLRRQADVIDNFASLHAELPPVRYEAPAPH